MAREKRELGLLALDSAILRSEDAQLGADEISFFASVAEAMWWLTMLDEALWPTHLANVSYKSARDSSPGARLLLGLRYARNRQVHDTQVTGMQGNPLLGPDNAHNDAWRWRSLDAPEVPPYEPREDRWGEKQEQVYRDFMATNEVLPTLLSAANFLNDWIDKLDAEPAPQ